MEVMYEDNLLFGGGKEEIYESLGDWGEEPDLGEEPVSIVAKDIFRTLNPLYSGNP